MLRTIITLLMCATFLMFGFLGEELLNVFQVLSRGQEYLPEMTLLMKESFPINCGFFLFSTFPFCIAVFVIFLATSQKPPLISRDRFVDYNFIVCLVYALYYAVFLTALVSPYHLLITKLNLLLTQ
jgi:hypothetical protein